MRGVLASLLVAAALAGCGGTTAYYAGETFRGNTMHQRAFAAPADRVCEAARVVLLGQGYVVTQAEPGNPRALVGSKEFQRKENRRAVLQVHSTCVATARGSTLYVTAVEAHFDLRQSKKRTSIGVPLISPLSITSSSESQAQLESAGETVESWRFYQRFYAAVRRALGAR